MSQQRDLSNYDTVKSRKLKFYIKYSDGRIILDALTVDDNSAFFKATTYINKEDQEKNLPLSTGYAQEFKGQGGFANKTSWCENCEESAVGRALDNAGFCSDLKCSKEEIIAAQNNAKAIAEKEKLILEIRDLLSTLTKELDQEKKVAFMQSNCRIKIFKELSKMTINELSEIVTDLKKQLPEMES